MMIHLLGNDRNARHKTKGLREIVEFELTGNTVARRFVRPLGEAGEERGALGIVEFPDHLFSPAGQVALPAIRKGAMSDKSSLPAGWTGAAPDADALFAMAEAALGQLPDVFKPHIEGVVIAIEEFADDATLKSLDIEHPYDLTGLYEGRPLTERSIDQSGGMPDRVTLYRIPILVEWIEGSERLDWLVRHVLIHEIGHHFGFSDDDMHALEDMA